MDRSATHCQSSRMILIFKVEQHFFIHITYSITYIVLFLQLEGKSRFKYPFTGLIKRDRKFDRPRMIVGMTDSALTFDDCNHCTFIEYVLTLVAAIEYD